MGKQTPISTTFALPDGREITIETGKLATQADGSVMIRMGKTMLIATVVSNKEPREGAAFFPLSVDYQEKFASVGRIPGNFFRREARLSDYEVLICRLVDRAIRPLFPDGYMNDTQVIINLISADEDAMPDAMAALAASAALSVSDIPWAGPISEVRVARINGQLVVNPGRSAMENADLDIIVAATLDNVMMVEGEAAECSEADLIEAKSAAMQQTLIYIILAICMGVFTARYLGSKIVTPGDSDQSELVRRIRSADIDERMPPAESTRHLSSAEIELLTAWVEQGAKWARHWAFATPLLPEIPGCFSSWICTSASGQKARAILQTRLLSSAGTSSAAGPVTESPAPWPVSTVTTSPTSAKATILSIR